MKDVLASKKAYLGKMITEETGKTITDSEGEISKSIQYIEYITKLSEQYFKDERIEHSTLKDVRLQYAPLGCVLKISPFNFPLWVPFKGLLAIMLAGNSTIFRPSDSCAQVGLEIE